MTSVFIVRACNQRITRYGDVIADEGYMCGVYPTKELAMARINFVKEDEDLRFDSAWYDEIKVGPNGADCCEGGRF